MRLTDIEQQAIKTTVLAFDAKARVFLFGSRTDDSKRGGDIDLLILSKGITLNQTIKIRVRLYDLIGEQKIDVLVAKPSR